jgi:hypothetical protein
MAHLKPKISFVGLITAPNLTSNVVLNDSTKTPYENVVVVACKCVYGFPRCA